MRCSKCGAGNRENARFCDSCGARLQSQCPSCAALTRAEAKFCDSCGAALTEPLSAPVGAAVAAPPPAPVSGERRHLTVLFCDLAGSTEIAAQLDPEDWRDVVAGYHRAAAEAIARFGGHVAKYLGDGVMAYFGWPEAHDNDGERAARAGLAILEGVLKLNQDSPGPQLAARIGIDSGSVVVGAGADKEGEIFGETPNIAARLQATAAPGTALVTAATHSLISGLFVVETLGRRALKGITTPLEVFRVMRPTGVRGRLHAAHGLTPFVGREEELGLLLSRWERTREGKGQMALINGEPGIGKSRLVAEFHDRVRDAPHIWMESAGEQLFENTPFHAVIEMLSRWLELQDSTNPEAQLERIELALVTASLNVAEVAPLIADLLQLRTSERYRASNMTGEQKRRRLLAALGGWVLGAARVQPLMMVVEDLHWLDPSTLELLQLLAERGATAPLMLLCTARPEFHAPWPMRTHHSQITLNRLSSHNVREMVAMVASRNALARNSVEAVVERTGGVPLFVEELTRAMLESGSKRGTGREIPATLHDSLMARLDRLGPAKEVIQIGAVIGSEFSYKLLHAVHSIPEDDLQVAIRGATNAELVYARGNPPDSSYQFKHALIRDAAYEALLRSRRRELHSRIAEVVVRQFPERATSAPELVAHHYTEAGVLAQAIPYWQRAGQNAVARSAHAEAVSHLTKALELLESTPDSSERVRQELALQITLGVALISIKGYTAPEVVNSYSRALELCRQVGETPELFPVLLGLTAFRIVRAEYQMARELGERLLRLAQSIRDPGLLVNAHEVFGHCLYFMGEFSSAREHCDRGMAFYEPQKHSPNVSGVFQDPGVACLTYGARTLWFLGYPQQALRKMQEALSLTQTLSHPYTHAFALTGAVILHNLRREGALAQERADAMVALCTEQGFLFLQTLATILQGSALTEQRHEEKGIAQIREGIAALRATGGKFNLSYYLALLIEAYQRAGRIEEGLATLAEALAVVDENGERLYEAELYRLRGQLTLQLAQLAHGSEHPIARKILDASQAEVEAESCFLRAIEIARRQSAKSWQLRATTSLARLRARQGRPNEARSLVAEIYGWFTEGFDTEDLKEAKELFDKLADN